MPPPSSAPPYEVVLPFPVARAKIPATMNWRSTWIVSSIQTLKTRGHFDKYVARLPVQHRDALLLCVAGMWLPITVARAHYAACEELGLARSEQLDMGLAVGERAQGTVLKTATRVATGSGVTPWTVVPQLQRLWERGADGGGTSVLKVGPKEAIVETVGCELFDVPYFRHAYAGVILGIVRLFCTRAYTHDETTRFAQGECTLRLQWA